MKKFSYFILSVILVIAIASCGRNRNEEEQVFKNALSELNKNLTLPVGTYQINPDDFEIDNSISINPGMAGIMPIKIGQQLAGQISFNAPNGNVVASGMRFGSSGNVNVTPISGAQGMTSGTMTVPFSVGSNTCADLSRICHDIKCYEFAITADGKISQANIRDVALMCGNCDEPSCASLIDPPCPPGPCSGNYSFGPIGSGTGLCGCSSAATSIVSSNGVVVVASNVGSSGSYVFNEDFYTGGCSTCPALQIQDASGTAYIAISGSGSWSGNVFSFSGTMKDIPSVVSGGGTSYSLSGSVNCQ